METDHGVKWRRYGALDGRAILIGDFVDQDLPIPEILRWEAERLLQDVTNEKPADRGEARA